MNPAKAKVLLCPHCGGEKEVLQLLSGNTFGAVLWSDNKQIAPMLPRVSFVQRCPECGHYYLLSQVKKQREGNNYSFETGELSWTQMKEALAESSYWNIDEQDELNFMLAAIWAYNDEFYRGRNSSVEGEEDENFKRQIIERLLKLIPDKILSAEFNREIGNFDRAISLIEEAHPTDPFLKDVASKISAKATDRDIKPFVLIGNDR